MKLFKTFTAFLVIAIWACGAGEAETQRVSDVRSRVEPKLRAVLAAQDIAWGAPIFVRIFKQENELELWLQGDDGAFDLFKTYNICAWSGALGPKLQQGDGQSPEGFYFVTPQAMNPQSQFHLSFNLGFPNAYDRKHGRTGSFLMVHGDCVSIGCYAMTDAAIEEIYLLADAAFSHGQPFFRVHAFPFRMSEEAMAAHTNSEWIDFWRNLKAGYDWFESHGKPPNVGVSHGQYVFNDAQ